MRDVEVLEALVAEQMAEAAVPGLALAIIEGGELAYVRGFGVTSVQPGAAR